MFFCSECDSIYDITKNKPAKQQTGGDNDDYNNSPSDVSSATETDNLTKLIDNIIAGKSPTDAELKKYTMDNLLANAVYKKLTSKNKDIVYNIFNDVVSTTLKHDNNAKATQYYFICNNCGNNEPIKEQTQLVTRSGNEKIQLYDDINKYKEIIHSAALPITRAYVCPNDKCESHKDHAKREAVFFRQSNSFKIRMICRTCLESWI